MLFFCLFWLFYCNAAETVAWSSTVSKLRWLYGNGKWELSIVAVVAKFKFTESFKFTKSRLVVLLSESEDTVIQTATSCVATGRKWTPSEAFSESSRLFISVISLTKSKYGRAGLGLLPNAAAWHKARGVQETTCWLKWAQQEAERVTCQGCRRG